ncbi:hypothetical protein [Agarilytica rhodophyticola]|uniref:hypothetical protein n=1 Tax=Agarilytica rhodophyticola TaxID=1737490 RepID=UPI000B3411AF|nr:hypothetical protein [Agarilytica rhodophyticola]
MSKQRIVIRRAIGELLSNHYDEPVYLERMPDMSNDEAAITCFFDSGDLDYQGVFASSNAIFIIGFHRKDLDTDDDLDVWSSFASNLLHENTLDGLVMGITEVGFEYGSDDAPEHSSLYLKFNISYVGK